VNGGNVVGIYLMGFVILVSGIGALGMAIVYAIRPTERKLALMRPLSLASIFAAICSFSQGMAQVLQGVGASAPFDATDVPGSVFMGLSETFVPLFLAFAFLAVAWLLVAVGLRRQE
jgi:hypothetical protein